jgi:AcrR family transcriptional regulator
MKSQDAQKPIRGQKEFREAGETRRLLLQAAQHLFSAYGYRAVSTKQIAEACGITQPALYKHFTDKQDLYVAMVLETLVPVKTALERIAQRSLSVREHLRLVAVYLLTTTRQDMMMMGHDMRYELTSQGQESLQHAFREAILLPLTTIFEEGMRQGLLRSPTQEGVTAFMATMLFLNLISTFVSQAPEATSFESQMTVEQQARLIVEFMLHGLSRYNEHDQ